MSLNRDRSYQVLEDLASVWFNLVSGRALNIMRSCSRLSSNHFAWFGSVWQFPPLFGSPATCKFEFELSGTDECSENSARLKGVSSLLVYRF